MWIPDFIRNIDALRVELITLQSRIKEVEGEIRQYDEWKEICEEHSNKKK